MIFRITPEQLRKMADQLDAYTALEAAGANHIGSSTPMFVDGKPLAYLHWWDDQQRYLAEFICFTPGDEVPLVYHDQHHNDLVREGVHTQ